MKQWLRDALSAKVLHFSTAFPVIIHEYHLIEL
jgi:hypothetical protein